MARRTIKVTIPGVRSENAGERDNGKIFTITEMPADQAERWCLKARILISEAMGIATAEPANAGEAAALAKIGIDFGNLRIWRALADPSLDEVWAYIEYQHAPRQPPTPIVDGENSPIEEIDTRLKLRAEALALNLGFSRGAARPSSTDSPTTTG